MTTQMNTRVAIVDYRLGNLYSVKLACEHVGLTAEITQDKQTILAAEAVILPGVGAFGSAMATLQELDLLSVLRDVADSGKPLFGICLGQQLLMESSEEFGAHEGLGIIKGTVVRLEQPSEKGRMLKVPQVGWNGIVPPPGGSFADSPLSTTEPGEQFYFVHSYVVRPEQPEVICALTTYGGIEFCSSIHYGNVFACQFHPERSGEKGLRVYRNFAESLLNQRNSQ